LREASPIRCVSACHYFVLVEHPPTKAAVFQFVLDYKLRILTYSYRMASKLKFWRLYVSAGSSPASFTLNPRYYPLLRYCGSNQPHRPSNVDSVILKMPCRNIYVYLLTTLIPRWSPLIRHYFTSAQGPTHYRSQDSAGCCYSLGRRHLRHVQLLTQCLQDEEWWLSLLAAPFLIE